MKKITDFIIEKRLYILVCFLVLTIVSFFMIQKVKINYDIAEYLPNTSETRIGMDIMQDEFEELSSSSFNLMFKGLKDEEKQKIHDELSKHDGVSSVNYEKTTKYNKDDYTMYVINVEDKEDSKLASRVFNDIKEKYADYDIYTSGAIANRNTPVLPVWIVFLAIGCALVILIIMCESYVEPFLFIISIGLAVFLNKGTNIIFDSVSNITDSIVAILQLALSMDYSIMLMNRYSQEKKKDKNKVNAMKKALYHSFASISSSSITTIVGLLALVFMSFTIGRDLGLVLAKGVLFSLISIFFVLPGLILMFDKWIVKTKKKTLNIKLNWLGKISYHCRYPSIALILIALVGSYLLKGNLTILYTNNEADKVAKVFPANNQIAIIYNKSNEDLIANHCRNLEKNVNVEDALCYGNTINEELVYDKLNAKLKDMGSDVSVDEYLLRIVYYNYYIKDNNANTTFKDLVKFIYEKVYTNDNMNEHVTVKMKKDIERLNNFITEDNINKKRAPHEIASILGINEEQVNDLFIYYNSLHNKGTLTLKEFIDFMNRDIMSNEKYSKGINEKMRNDLKILTKFTNINIINRSLSSSEMANLFGVDKKIMDDLYSYYLIKNPIDTKLSLHEFSAFVVEYILTDESLSQNIDAETRNTLNSLHTFSDKAIITKKMNSESLSKLFNLDSKLTEQLLLLYYMNVDDGTKYTLKNFAIELIKVKVQTDYLDGINIRDIESLEEFVLNQNNINNTKISKETLKKYFDDHLVNKTYSELKIDDNYKMTPQEFIDKVLNYLDKYIDEETKERLQLIKMAIVDNTEFTSTELSKVLNVDEKVMYKLYALINYNRGNTKHWMMTPYELVNLLLNNNDKLDNKQIETLQLIKTIMDSTLNGEVYNQNELAAFLNLDSNTVNSIYALYNSKYHRIKLSPKKITTFILNNSNDQVLKNALSNDMLTKIKLLDKIMTSTMDEHRYSSSELSDLLGIDKSTLDLIYSLYDYQNNHFNLSLKEFVNFLLKDVITNSTYNSKFKENDINKLTTINDVMIGSLNGQKYGYEEAYRIFDKLHHGIDKDLIELVYIYYGSEYNYDLDWKLTIERFVNYLNSDIIHNELFTDFLDDDMKHGIQESKNTIDDVKKLLVGQKYSRVVLNTNFKPESKETFAFISELKDNLGNKDNDIYVIGDSPMAYEMSQTFNSELDFITILTMIFIFVVVAITFKSIIIPIILIMIIQCAVYMTMGILSLIGGNVYFIALLIVQSILMGATIDYAILYTSYYLESREKLSIKEAIINSYNKSIHTILTSSSILIIVTLIVGNFTSAVASKICKTLSQGTMCAALLILLILPAVLAASDKIIIKKKRKISK